MNQNTLEAISIAALVVSLVVLMVLVVRWIVKRWFVGSWADKIIGGGRDAFEVSIEDIETKLKDRCKALQDAIINGTPITYETMEPIINAIYLAFRADCRLYNRITEDWYPPLTIYFPEDRQRICRIVTSALKSAPLAALILMASPYMFRRKIRRLFDSEPIYRMLVNTACSRVESEILGFKSESEMKRIEQLTATYFDPIYQSIHDNVSSSFTHEFICEQWSNRSATLMSIASALMINLDNKLGYTIEKATNALKEIVIPDVYELLRSEGATLTLDNRLTRLDNLPEDGEPRYKAKPK